jgi:hypothetical protein
VPAAAAPPAAPAPRPPQIPASGSGLEPLLQDIAGRLASIESMYGEMSSRLSRVDNRTEHNERSVRELQHISAGAISETARLVDLMGCVCALSSQANPAPSDLCSPFSLSTGRSTSPLALRAGMALTSTPPSHGPSRHRGAGAAQHSITLPTTDYSITPSLQGGLQVRLQLTRSGSGQAGCMAKPGFLWMEQQLQLASSLRSCR